MNMGNKVFEPFMERQQYGENDCFWRDKERITVMKVRLRYLVLFILLLATEILIGVFLKGGFIRAYGGDILILPLLYAFLRILFPQNNNFTKRILPFGLFVFGAFVEVLQGVHIADRLHITSPLVRVIIGSTFDYLDIACYFAGMLLIYGFLHLRN